MIGFIYLCGVFLLIFGIVLFFQCNMGDLYDLYSLISVFFYCSCCSFIYVISICICLCDWRWSEWKFVRDALIVFRRMKITGNPVTDVLEKNVLNILPVKSISIRLLCRI